MTRFHCGLLAATCGAGLFVVAGAGATAFNEAPPAPALISDIRVGERGYQTRIALFCKMECAPEWRGGGVFLLPGAGDEFTLDMTDARARVTGLIARPTPAGAVLKARLAGPLADAAAGPCQVGGEPAVCLDFYFEDADTAKAADAAAPSEPMRKKSDAPSQASAPPPTAETTRRETETARRAAAPPPALRETADSRLRTYASLSEPERLSPPILAKVQPIEDAVAVATPTFRPGGRPSQDAETNFGARIAVLLGKNLSPAYCNNAEATLQTDAWALGAMVDVGLCAGARGDVVEAESILSRLLEYAPDNYEALVGKALIAEQAGERGAALRYYQDALDAPAPPTRSARIIEAMAAIS